MSKNKLCNEKSWKDVWTLIQNARNQMKSVICPDLGVPIVKYARIDIYEDQITSIKRGNGPSGATLTPLVHEYQEARF